MNYIYENILRNQKLDQYYNPYTGEGSRQERQLFELSDLGEKLHLPLSMLNVQWVQELGKCRSMREYIRRNKSNPVLQGVDAVDVLENVFMNERLDHDFEYWAATCANIKPKKGGEFIPFVLNPPQRILLYELEKMRLSMSAIFFILLKSRQFGGSTMIQIYMLWIQLRHKINWNSLIAAHINQAAINVRSMVGNVIKKYPEYAGEISLKAFEGTTNIKIIPERSNKITIGSMEKPDSIRSDDVKMAHLTEVGIWKKTQGKEPEDLCQSILGTIPIDEPYVLFGIESTAKGVGSYFHRTWQQAVKGDNGIKPIFISWLQDQKNRIQFTENESKDEFIKSFSDYDYFLWNKGATLEGIKFYRKQLAVFNNDKWRMQSEFPTTAEEAFQSTGNRYFPPSYVLALRKDNKEPIFKGEVIGDSTLGIKALNNILFEANERGNLWIWEYPVTSDEWIDRYVVSLDLGGTTDKADFSIIRAFDRLPMINGGDPVAILTWRGHLDHDLIVWKGIQISKMCSSALFVPEDNSLEKESDGEHFQTILDQIKDIYPNIYIRNNVETVGNDFVPKYGWLTNKKTKGLALDTLKSAARERMNKDLDCQDGYSYVEYDERNCSEMDSFEIKQTGKLGAIDGGHDDLCMTTAIGLHVAINELSLPKPKSPEFIRINKRRTESTF